MSIVTVSNVSHSFGGREILVDVSFRLLNGEHVGLICEQLYDLALLQQAPLQPEAMTKFINRSNQLMMLLAE